MRHAPISHPFPTLHIIIYRIIYRHTPLPSSRGPAGFARMDFIGYLWVYQISVSCICELYYCHFASRPPCRPRPTHYPTGPTTPFCPDFTPTPKSYTRKTRVATTSTPPPTDSRDGVVGISTCSHRTTSPTGTTTA